MTTPSENKIILDRMEIEEAGLNPEKLARAVHEQLGNVQILNVSYRPQSPLT